jgi:hypothetical protein
LVWLFKIKNWNSTNQLWFGSISVRFCYFILKTENYIVFWGFFGLSNEFFSVRFFSIRFSLIYFLTKPIQFDFFNCRLMKPNRTKFFKNILISFFHDLIFSVIFFQFSQFNRFVNFFTHLYPYPSYSTGTILGNPS